MRRWSRLLDRLKLTAIRDQLDTLLDEPARSEMSLREALAFLAGREIARRDEQRIGMASGFIGFSDLVRHAIQDGIVEQPCRRISHTSHSRSIFRPAVIIDVLVAMDDQA